MSLRDHLRKVTAYFLKKILTAPQSVEKNIGTPKTFLIIRQNNQFGDMLASISLFRAIKETFPNSKITLIVSPQNYFAVEKNILIDEIFLFDNKKIWKLTYAFKLKKVLIRDYDVVINPAPVAVSFTSCILAGLAKSKIKIGPAELNGNKNNLAFVFNHQIKLDWRMCPDAHVSDFILDIVRPFGISTKNYQSTINFDDADQKVAREFLKSIFVKDYIYTIGFHVGAGKIQNRWPLEFFAELIKQIGNRHHIKFYFTGSSSDKEEISFMKKIFDHSCGYFIDRSIPQLAALISESDLFITNDTGVMHVAGTTTTPQISLFGPTNPFNWAPVGKSKYFIRKSGMISDISVEDVFNLFETIVERDLAKK
jgi:heptosyltransferase-2